MYSMQAYVIEHATRWQPLEAVDRELTLAGQRLRVKAKLRYTARHHDAAQQRAVASRTWMVSGDGQHITELVSGVLGPGRRMCRLVLYPGSAVMLPLPCGRNNEYSPCKRVHHRPR